MIDELDDRISERTNGEEQRSEGRSNGEEEARRRSKGKKAGCEILPQMLAVLLVAMEFVVRTRCWMLELEGRQEANGTSVIFQMYKFRCLATYVFATYVLRTCTLKHLLLFLIKKMCLYLLP